MPTQMRFLLDENVADAVGRFLTSLGHEVLAARDVLGRSTPNQILAFVVETEGLILVTHDKDFKRLSQTLPQGHQGRVTNGAGRLQLSGPEARAVEFLKANWDSIEFHYQQCARADRRFIARITVSNFTVIRNAKI